MREKHAVTGAFGYTGSYIARHLLEAGQEVITLTNSSQRENSLTESVKAYPFHFDNAEELTESLRGVRVLYNTYWVRFNHKLFTHADAVRKTKVLFDCAKAAGVEKIVHVSITNPDVGSDLEYFSGKGELENYLMDLGLAYSILRPAVIFGDEDVLINNIAWGLRRAPVIAVFGDGEYRLQPIYVDDFALLAVREGRNPDSGVVDAIGPETFTYRELIGTVGERIGVSKPLVSLPPDLCYVLFKMMGWWVGDVILTREEIRGLMDDLLYVDAPPAGDTRLSDWISEHADALGRDYTSELARRVDRRVGYS